MPGPAAPFVPVRPGPYTLVHNVRYGTGDRFVRDDVVDDQAIAVDIRRQIGRYADEERGHWHTFLTRRATTERARSSLPTTTTWQ